VTTKINGYALAGLAAGFVLFWSGFTGKGVLASVQSLIQGKSPQSNPTVNSPQDPAQGTTGSTTGAGYSIATNIPAGKGSYSQSGLQQLWINNGGPSNTAAFAAAVAMAESGGNANITSTNPDGGINVGLWQLDTKGVGSPYSVQELSDANLNCQKTIMATSGGTNWSEWGDPVAAAVGHHYTPGAPVP
jgi:hypothetical protein